MTHFRTLLFLLYSMLFLAFLYLSVLVSAYDYTAVKALGDILYCELAYYKFRIDLSAPGLLIYRLAVYSSFGLLLLLLWLSSRLRSIILDELHLLRKEAQLAVRAVKHRLQMLSAAQCLLVLAIFVLTAIARLYFLFRHPLRTDETATYDYFVMEGIEAVTGFYPIPNNHIFQSLLYWISYQVNPDFYFSVRGTTFLIGLLGLFLLFVLLLVITNFRTAAAFALMTGLSNMPFYYSILGRGYTLTFLLAGIGFVCTYFIIRGKTTYKRLGYFGLTLSTVLGLYTVPPYLYAFATFGFILAAAGILRKQFCQIYAAAGVAGIAGLVTIALYSPVFIVSGLKAMFGNSYVASKDPGTIVAKYKGYSGVILKFINYFKSAENIIVGDEKQGYIILGAVILAAAGLILTRKLPPQKILLCIMAVTGILLPYLFFVLQRLLPPERTLVYKSFFFFMLAAIVADAVLGYYFRNRRVAAAVLGLLLLVYAGAGVRLSYKMMKLEEPQEQQRQQVWEKVMQGAPASMYITDPFYQLFFLHYSKQSGHDIRLTSDFEKGQNYDILIVGPEAELPESLDTDYNSIYQDSVLTVYDRIRSRNALL